MAALRRFGRLAYVLRWATIELLFALRAAEMVRLPFELRVSSGGSRFYIHAAHRVFHCCYGLHQYSPGISCSFRCTAVASPESALEGKGFLWLAAGYQSRTWAIPTNREAAYALAALSADTADAVPVTEVQALLPRSRRSSRRRRRLQRGDELQLSSCGLRALHLPRVKA